MAKCEFARSPGRVTYLGKVVGQGFVLPVKAQVLAIDLCQVPSTKEELIHFLGLEGYHRGFCKNVSTAVASLRDFLKGKAKFIGRIRPGSLHPPLRRLCWPFHGLTGPSSYKWMQVLEQ